ncbi:tRNA lysidine(34) synthetase TilS [Geminicoccus roseus]|uniref:tRNA lysidine(34) synthetase TilS n=1 Tax=Geminicoccus roseus TaxID=404900 RepID=UPI000418E915|nr:tRNA lysidine(34) synthetase TilS [Geminicoccus roseus]
MAGFGPFEPRPKVAVAVSGGADSVCLAILADAWTAERQGEIRAFVVDHGLREGSAAEARLVLGRLEALGIAGQVLCWRHDPVASRIQQRAREARYALLEEAVAAWGALHLLLGHHADDQAETVAMRRARGSGPLGLSGMPAVSERARIRILRPLLHLPKAQLVAELQARGIPWVEDPSNRDQRFARARLRRQGGLPERAAAEARCRLDEGVARFLAAHGWIAPDRRVWFERAPFRALAPDMARHLLGRVIAAMTDRPYLPSGTGLARLAQEVQVGAPGAATLGGCLVRHGERWVRIRPERVHGLPWRPPIPLAPVPFGAGADAATILLHSPGNLCST